MPTTPPRSEPTRRTLIVGDVHGCAEELAALLELAKADRVVLVGDLFTKGPDPAGVWELIERHQLEAVLGNHDDHVLRHWKKRRLPEAAWPWLKAVPLFRLVAGVIVVHAGLHPTLGIGGTSRLRALTQRRHPGGPKDPFWYDAGWKGPLVVFGHDARRGLVRRVHEGRLIALGLDTGCVYGGRLTGWIREEDRLVSVKAAKVWHPVG